MSAYYIIQMEEKDPVKLSAYTTAAPATVKAFGGELVFRGKVSEVVSGQPTFSSAVVLKFTDQAAAKNWYESKEYQGLLKYRDAGADVTVTRYLESDFF